METIIVAIIILGGVGICLLFACGVVWLFPGRGK